MYKVSIIVAVASNMAIGKNNDLLCHLSDDLQHFKSITSGHTVIMGRNTWESLPKKPLPNRTNIVITSHAYPDIPNTIFVGSPTEALSHISPDEEVFVMGGASIYKLFMPLASKLYVTWIHKDFDGDVFFPEIDYNSFISNEKSDLITDEKSGISFHYENYIKR